MQKPFVSRGKTLLSIFIAGWGTGHLFGRTAGEGQGSVRISMCYSGTRRNKDFAQWVLNYCCTGDKRKVRFGNLLMEDKKVFSYSLQIADVHPQYKLILCNNRGFSYSRTTTMHMHCLAVRDLPGWSLLNVEDKYIGTYTNVVDMFQARWGKKLKSNNLASTLEFYKLLNEYAYQHRDKVKNTEPLMQEYVKKTKLEKQAMWAIMELATDNR